MVFELLVAFLSAVKSCFNLVLHVVVTFDFGHIFVELLKDLFLIEKTLGQEARENV